MQLITIAFFCLALAATLAYEIVQDPEGQNYYLVPLYRAKRHHGEDHNLDNIKWKIESPGVFSLEHKKDFIVNDRHKFETTAGVVRNFHNHNSPTVTTGKVDYTNIPTGNTFGIKAQDAGRFGQNLGLEGKYNIVRKGPLSVDATANYGRHFGGPGGTQHPELTGMINANIALD